MVTQIRKLLCFHIFSIIFLKHVLTIIIKLWKIVSSVMWVYFNYKFCSLSWQCYLLNIHTTQGVPLIPFNRHLLSWVHIGRIFYIQTTISPYIYIYFFVLFFNFSSLYINITIIYIIYYSIVRKYMCVFNNYDLPNITYILNCVEKIQKCKILPIHITVLDDII